MTNELTQSIFVTGPSGVGKSSFARSAIQHEGGGLVLSAPGFDELDSYFGLKYTGMGFDDVGYPAQPPTGLKEATNYLYARLAEVKTDREAGLKPRYPIIVVDTISAFGQLALNKTMGRFKVDTAPAAQSPDGAAFYTFVRSQQEEFLRIVRAFKGYGVHVLVLSHVGEGDTTAANTAMEVDAKVKMYVPAVPGGFKHAISSYFSTVLSAGIAKNKEGQRVHYLQWKADGKKGAKSRLGFLDEKPYIVVEEGSGWKTVKNLIEAAASRRSDGGKEEG